MKNYLSISIPKPCNEDWTKMTPKEKGRFCSSCSKIVVDFTGLNQKEIIDYIQQNNTKTICGHFRQSQLDSINLHIPTQILETNKFHKLFLLVLLIVMGTSLMNCTNRYGDIQKIESVEVVDSINFKVIDIQDNLSEVETLDSLSPVSCSTKKQKHSKNPESLSESTSITTEETGEVITLGEPKYLIKEEDTLTIDGKFEMINDSNSYDDTLLGFVVMEESPPEFFNTPQDLTTEEKREYFQKKINDIVSKNFNVSQENLGLTGIQRIYVQFKIDSLGSIKNIKVRAPHPKFEEEAIRVIKLLPQFIPAKQRGEAVSVIYNLPIYYQIED